MATQWTNEQKQAIFDRNGTLLVSAAAGSGKTAVLVERIISRIIDMENPCDADRLLVATFSNAAATEMQERIMSRLSAQIKAQPNNVFLKKQEILLSKAYISTVHSFCLDLIKKNFHILGISADVRIGDEKELEIIYNETATQVIEDEYKKSRPEFLELVEMMSTGRDDKNLRETLLEMYKYIRSHSFYDEWLDKMLEFYIPTDDICTTRWGKVLLNHANEVLKHISSLIDVGLDACEDEIIDKAFGKVFLFAQSIVKNLNEALENGNWDLCCTQLCGINYPRRGSVKDSDYADDVERLAKIWDNIKDLLRDLSEKVFICTGSEFKDDIIFLRPRIEEFFELVRNFDRALYANKEAKRLIDFSDIEHYTLRLLYDKTDDGHKPSKLAEEYRDKFDMVIVDEYQDTNEAQEMIFKSLSTEKNRFMVGDLKQSIYRFRQAMPEIFLQKKKDYTRYDGQNYPATIIFNRNFRSRSEVTDYVNLLFGDIMSENVGDIKYEGEETLKPAASFPQAEGMTTELHMVFPSENEDNTTAEAAHVAKQIAKMLDDGFVVCEKGVKRNARPSDFAILLRSPKKKAAEYVSALSAQGIEAVSEAKSDYLDSLEVSSVLALLKVISNPTRDISVAAVLLSPIFSFTASELANIKLEGEKTLYLSALRRAQNGDEHCKEFIERLGKLRRECSTLPSYIAVQKIFDETDIIPIISSMKNPEQRMSNLYMLVDYARECERRGYRGIDGFVGFTNRLSQIGSDFDAATDINDGTNSVRIMSIHRSKGLEFPVVFLCDTAKNFNKRDLSMPTLINSDLGFATKRRDTKTKKQFTTIPLEAVRFEEERQSLSEEMRILYVALTRAKEKLIITGIGDKKDTENIVVDNGNVSEFNIKSAKSYADWIFASALLHSDISKISTELSLGKNCEVTGENGIFQIKYFFDARSKENEEISEEINIPDDEGIYEKISEAISSKYEFEKATQTTALKSVSAILEKGKPQRLFSKKPSFMLEEKLTGAKKGTAFHEFLKYANYEKAIEDFSGECERLVEEKFISKRQAESVDREVFKKFTASDLYRRMKQATWCEREFEFLVLMNAQDTPLLSDIGDESISVQGIADVVFEEDGEIVIADYKTDRVEDASQLWERYAEQLNLYAIAIEKLTGKKVKEKILYSLDK